MKKRIIVLVTSTLLIMCSTSYASWFSSIFNSLLRIEGFDSNILKNITEDNYQLNDIDSLMKNVRDNIAGNYGMGTYHFHDYQTYGSDAANWNSVLDMSAKGKGSSELGLMISDISDQYPANVKLYNESIKDSYNQKYYALKFQTVLSTRAASQLDYNKIQDQIRYQQMLQEQIEHTKSLKEAVDLQNRLQVEGNLINLEILRQSALSNQQQAVTEQASVNAAIANARFLNKK